MDQKLKKRTEVGLRVAKEAGELLIKFYCRLDGYEKKGPLDLVSEADKNAEEMIVNAIHKAFPEDRIIAEEDGEHQKGSSEFTWIIDPLDGTTNFVHGHPNFAVSIGLSRGDELVFGAVNSPVREEFFHGILNGGAYLNSEPIQVSKTRDFGDALVAGGFSYDRMERIDVLMERVKKILMNARGFRREGAAALDLCSVAAGRLDAYWEDNLNAWDVAAGVLILTEAGGRVSAFDGSPHDIFAKNTVATNGKVHQALLDTLFN